MRYLSGKDLADLVSPAGLVAALEQGLRDFAAGRATAPTRQHVHFGENILLTMPAIGDGAFGVKVVSFVPSNAVRGVPVLNGLMMLNDGDSGAPLAVLDGAALTAQRTGAIGALGLKYTTPPDIDSIGIVGTGVQGIQQAIFSCAVRDIRTIRFVARSDEKAQRFVDAVSRHVREARLVRCADVRELLRHSQAVVVATTSSDPVLPAERELLENRHFIGIGSFKPSMQELPMLVHELARQVVVDSDAAKVEVGDLIGPLAARVLREDDVVHIAGLVVAERTIDTGRTTVFKSVGMALYDLYAARAFYDEALAQGRGVPLD